MKFTESQLLNLKAAVEMHIEALNHAFTREGDKMLKYKIDQYLDILYKLNNKLKTPANK
jgi:hypothetical protein